MRLSDEQIEEMVLDTIDSPSASVYRTLDEYPGFLVYFSRKTYVVINPTNHNFALMDNGFSVRKGRFTEKVIQILSDMDTFIKTTGVIATMVNTDKRTVTYEELSNACARNFDQKSVTDIICSLANSRLEQPSTKLLRAKKTHSILKESMEDFTNLPDVYSTTLSDMAKEASGVEMDDELQFWINLHKKLGYEPHPSIKFVFA